jgi:hypothetical protein
MTEFTHLVDKAREDEAFARWTTQPKYLLMDAADGILVTKFNDGHIWYEDHGKSTYSFPPDYKKDSWWERLRHLWGGR